MSRRPPQRPRTLIPIDFLVCTTNNTENTSINDPLTYYQLLEVGDEGKFLYNNRTIIVNERTLVDIHILGHGHFGNVMLAEVNDESETIQMAVKRLNLLPSIKKQNEYTTHTDLRTIRTVGSGMNPHVTTFYTAFVDKSNLQLLICMEVCETSMEKFYRSMHSLQVYQWLDLLLKQMINHIVDALNFLKNHKILHRDVKPSNILINQNPIIFKLCDFGICSPLINSLAASNTKGTQLYLAPERIDGNLSPQGYGIRSDMWSLGLSIIEIATNKHPLYGQDIFGIIHRSEEWIPPIPENLSQDLQDLTRWLLKIKPNDRPASYEEILSLLVPQEITTEAIEMVKKVIENIPKGNDFQ